MDFLTNFKFPGYTDGLAVTALLFFIFLMMFKTEKKMQLPNFCDTCVNRRQRLFFDSSYCKLKCKYNPLHEHGYTGIYYVKRHV